MTWLAAEVYVVDYNTECMSAENFHKFLVNGRSQGPQSSGSTIQPLQGSTLLYISSRI